MSYIGNTPTTQSFISGTDYFNGTGAQTAFTLTRTVASVNDIEAVVNNVVQQPNDAYTISGTTITFTSAPSAGTSNVYVRYLSTTTQAITPSQNTVSWSTLDSNVQGDLGISFKNRIINSNMAIDQRNAGASVTPTTGVYTLDRWLAAAYSASSKFSVQQNAGSVTPPAGFTNYLGVTSLSAYSISSSDFLSMIQSIEGYNAADLGWGTASAKTVTLSFQVRSSLTGTFGGALSNLDGTRSYPFSYTISAANTWTPVSVTIVGDTSGTWNTTNGVGIQLKIGIGVGSTYSGTAGAWAGANYFSTTGAVSVVGTNGATFYLTGVQLEVGTQATTFTTAGGSYGAELALCQRYYQQYGGTSSQYYFWGPAYDASNIYNVNPYTLPVVMRVAPTITNTTISGFITGDGLGNNPVLTSITWSSAPQSFTAQIASSGSGTGAHVTGRMYVLLSLGGSNAKVFLSSEL
jgi:hypothetical protein